MAECYVLETRVPARELGQISRDWIIDVLQDPMVQGNAYGERYHGL